MSSQGTWSLRRGQTDFILHQSRTAEWLAEKIFNTFPAATGLVFYILDCGCIYHRRQAFEGGLDTQIVIYRDPAKGGCAECLPQPVGWEARVLDEMVIYKIRLEAAF